jgi:very-short-patch-repair endonuclease
MKACMDAGLPTPSCEFRFHPVRKWRFDYVFLDYRVAIEREGGVWTGGRHTRGAGFMKDMEKYNTATSMGWKILRFTPSDIHKLEAIELIKQTLGI